MDETQTPFPVCTDELQHFLENFSAPTGMIAAMLTTLSRVSQIRSTPHAFDVMFSPFPVSLFLCLSLDLQL